MCRGRALASEVNIYECLRRPGGIQTEASRLLFLPGRGPALPACTEVALPPPPRVGSEAGLKWSSVNQGPSLCPVDVQHLAQGAGGCRDLRPNLCWHLFLCCYGLDHPESWRAHLWELSAVAVLLLGTEEAGAPGRQPLMKRRLSSAGAEAKGLAAFLAVTLSRAGGPRLCAGEGGGVQASVMVLGVSVSQEEDHQARASPHDACLAP